MCHDSFGWRLSFISAYAHTYLIIYPHLHIRACLHTCMQTNPSNFLYSTAGGFVQHVTVNWNQKACWHVIFPPGDFKRIYTTCCFQVEWIISSSAHLDPLCFRIHLFLTNFMLVVSRFQWRPASLSWHVHERDGYLTLPAREVAETACTSSKRRSLSFEYMKASSTNELTDTLINELGNDICQHLVPLRLLLISEFHGAPDSW